ncbi:hypothetical protein LTS18_010246 [Coniosporium uncinatum]|uniref:Uncharacterized protein n=1 Tax=Coniosporium uncinatum TaxID=93489 RepID=A0ACC3D9Q9_9PEZI|nr:hypothetical protein LTS18_010246 [Coniosporium uncinatum]
MAIIAKPGGTKLDKVQVKDLVANAGLKLSDGAIEDWSVLLGSLDDAIKEVLARGDDISRPDLSKYPRSDIFAPKDAEESDKGGWATRCTVTSTSPTSSLLKGKTVALKDNIALAGVRCLNGVKPVDGEWVPERDATVVTRMLDAGCTIIGKAACESACMEPSSDTSYTGIIHNPYADNYACGGSSSGSGRLVGSGAVDMALGCDQGGSVRIPASFCGIVGHKATWGLVPYSGILGLHAEIDHCGPMTRTVRDNALLLEAIAGPDGMDDRQPPSMPAEALQYSSSLDKFLAETSQDKPLSGFKIGVLKEGFALPVMDANVDKAVRSAVADLAKLGAEVIDVSVPGHNDICTAWMCTLPYAGGRDGLLGDRTGRKELYMTDRAAGANPGISQDLFDAWGAGAQNLYMRYLYVTKTYGSSVHAKAANLIRKYTQEYDAALSTLDALVMPTLPFPATKSIEQDDRDAGPLKRLQYMAGVLLNTAPFNSTGHPALSFPVGFVPARDDAALKLPTGMQVVCKQFDDLTCLKIAAAWERSKDWKSLSFGI